MGSRYFFMKGRALRITMGLLMIFTGDGKGKTTAALGLSLRAAGHGMKTAFLQFIKGSWHYGELDAIRRFSDLIQFEVLGRGFTWQSDDPERDRALADRAWRHAKEVILSHDFPIVVLDEFTYVINYGMVDIKDVIMTLKKRPDNVHVVITGRNAHNDLIKIADMITEMREIRHHFKKGVKAQKGIEF